MIRHYFILITLWKALKGDTLANEQSIIFGNIGDLYNEQKKYDTAREYLFKALEIDLKTGDKKGVAISYSYIAGNYLCQKNFEQALKYYKNSLELSKEIDYKPGIMKSLIESSDVYLQMIKDGLNEHNKPITLEQKKDFIDKILKLSNDANSVFNALNDKKGLMQIYSNLSNAYAEIKDWERGYKFNNLYHNLKDSIFNQESKIKIASLEAQRENELKEKNFEIQIKEKDYKNLILIVASALIAVIAVIFLFFLMKSKKTNRLLNEKNIKITETTEEVEHLNMDLVQRETQLMEANLTKDKFLSIISHDLKTPVSSFNNLAELVSEYYHDLSDEEKIEHLNSLKNSSRNVLKLLENLLVWSRVQDNNLKSHPENFNIKEIIMEEIKVCKESADNKKIKLNLISRADDFVFADKDMTKFIIRNLIANAIKFSYIDSEIKVIYKNENGKIEVSVSDSGIGISDEDKEKLFRIDVKHSTYGTSNEKGTGLGLNLCKEFTEKNNGELEFESKINMGSRFFFTLPIAEFD